jgi:hypothetical protein
MIKQSDKKNPRRQARKDYFRKRGSEISGGAPAAGGALYDPIGNAMGDPVTICQFEFPSRSIITIGKTTDIEPS